MSVVRSDGVVHLQPCVRENGSFFTCMDDLSIEVFSSTGANEALGKTILPGLGDSRACYPPLPEHTAPRTGAF